MLNHTFVLISLANGTFGIFDPSRLQSGQYSCQSMSVYTSGILFLAQERQEAKSEEKKLLNRPPQSYPFSFQKHLKISKTQITPKKDPKNYQNPKII